MIAGVAEVAHFDTQPKIVDKEAGDFLKIAMG